MILHIGNAIYAKESDYLSTSFVIKYLYIWNSWNVLVLVFSPEPSVDCPITVAKGNDKKIKMYIILVLNVVMTSNLLIKRYTGFYECYLSPTSHTLNAFEPKCTYVGL